jgi:hypothetical protein
MSDLEEKTTPILQTAIVIINARNEIANDVLAYASHLTAGEFAPRKQACRIERDQDNRRKVRYCLYDGSQSVNFSSHVITIEMKRRDDQIVYSRDESPSTLRELELRCKNRYDTIDEFIKKAHEYCRPKSDDRRIFCKRWMGKYWETFARHRKRKLETLFLPEGTTEAITRDIRDFLSSEDDYRNFGQPYKRVYLLHGKPGLGKSSLAFALACEFNFDLYVYSADENATDLSLSMAFVSIPDDNFIFLIEDVDSLLVQDKVTVSGITNLLDGVHVKDRMIVFMTTNYPETLDPAIVRPGRVDYTVRFGHATYHQVKSILLYHFSNQCEENDPRFQRTVQKLCDQRVTTAWLSEFLFQHRKSKDILSELSGCSKSIRRTERIKNDDDDDTQHGISMMYL